MNATSIETFGAILVNDGARSIRLSVSPSEHAHSNLNPGSAADPAGRRPVVSYTGQWNDLHQSCDLVDDEARRAVELAQLYTSIHLGGPAKMVVSWTLTRGDSSGSQVPPIAGPSIFGMFCMAFMRLVAVHARSASKPLSREICDLTAGINTSKLAFSVGFCPSSGRFEKVGKIEQKLEALSALGIQTCCACIVAQNQGVSLGYDRDISSDYAVYKMPTGQSSIPVVRAVDPIDAVRKLFSLHAVSGLTC